MVRSSPFIALLLFGVGAPVHAQTRTDGKQNRPPADKPRADALGDPLPPGAILRLGTVRWRPSGSIHHLAFAPDGKRLASWHEEHYTTAAATIWDVASGRELRRVEIPGLSIHSWTWLNDDRGISIVATSEGPYVWEFSDDKIVPPHTFQPMFGVKVAAGGPVTDQLACFAISPDGSFLVAGKAGAPANKERDLVLWDLKTQCRVADLPKPRRIGAVPNSCNNLFFTPDSKKLVAFCRPMDKKAERKEHLIAVVDATSGKELRRFNTAAPLQQGSRMSFALSSQYLAVGLEDEIGTVLLWDLEKDQDRQLASGHGKRDKHSGFGVSGLTFSNDGQTLITAGRDSAVRTWDIPSLKEQRVIPDAYPGWIETLAVTRDGKRLACAGQDGIIRHWDLATGVEVDAVDGPAARIWGASMTRDGTVAVTSGADGCLRIWDVPAARLTRTIALPTKRSSAQAIMAPDGRTVVASIDNRVAAWNAATGEQVRPPELPPDLKTSHLRFSDNGKTLIAIHSGTVTLLDWPSAKLRRQFILPEPLREPGEAHCDAAALSGDGRWLATLAHRYSFREERGMRFGFSSDGVLDLWDATTGARVHRLVDTRTTGRNLFFTTTGDLLCDLRGTLHPLAGGAEVELEGAFSLIDPLTGRLRTVFEPAPALGVSHRYNAAMGIAADGRSIYCTGNDGVIHIYETATGKIRRSLMRHRDYISGVSATSDGRRLLTASLDLTALVWDISLAAADPKGGAAPARDEQARLWDRLTNPDAKDAYAAMATLAAHPQIAVAVIRAGIQPAASSPTDATLDRLVAELGSDVFAVRERATRELDTLGEAAVPGMRARLAKSPALETQRRMARFLEKHDPATLTPVHLREIRALEILEQLNTPESRSLLEAFAKGAANARLTRSAAAVLARQR